MKIASSDWRTNLIPNKVKDRVKIEILSLVSPAKRSTVTEINAINKQLMRNNRLLLLLHNSSSRTNKNSSLLLLTLYRQKNKYENIYSRPLGQHRSSINAGEANKSNRCTKMKCKIIIIFGNNYGKTITRINTI